MWNFIKLLSLHLSSFNIFIWKLIFFGLFNVKSNGYCSENMNFKCYIINYSISLLVCSHILTLLLRIEIGRTTLESNLVNTYPKKIHIAIPLLRSPPRVTLKSKGKRYTYFLDIFEVLFIVAKEYRIWNTHYYALGL